MKVFDTKYTIVIDDLSFRAILGLLENERKEEQLVVVCAKIGYEDKKEYVDYAKVCDIIQNTIIEGKFKLIEDAIDEVESKLKESFPQMKALYLKIRKPEILKNALAGVEILRKY
ncbi:dihydroneopterin aldolase [Caminibacter mediatlanticus TB-2]|uniref:dihydroneopterin aldolase n=1 Tax=Caminibacter mediatlanticus TB-2 TaxID=391592 RepID=A0AAI9AHD2_9BACT|nr:dihydroneopterin aldolase [Caminibacter mediatlanticus]EDM23535.1 Dihydroneopterin aldolase [Caminibacter mediatlanticus TB-2]QCT94106.1 dihydroneopterin aldolase [Caminibacter mediatlanticus TB-2]